MAFLLRSGLVVGMDPLGPVLKVGWDDGFGPVDEEERRATSRPIVACPQTPQDPGELFYPLPGEWLKLVMDSGGRII